MVSDGEFADMKREMAIIKNRLGLWADNMLGSLDSGHGLEFGSGAGGQIAEPGITFFSETAAGADPTASAVANYYAALYWLRRRSQNVMTASPILFQYGNVSSALTEQNWQVMARKEALNALSLELSTDYAKVALKYKDAGINPTQNFAGLAALEASGVLASVYAYSGGNGSFVEMLGNGVSLPANSSDPSDSRLTNGWLFYRTGTPSFRGYLKSIWADFSQVIHRAADENDVKSTSSETTLYSFTVPGGILGTTRAVRVRIIGDYLNDTGSNRNLSVSVKYGTTTLWGDSRTLGASANRRSFHLDVVMGNRNSASVQRLGGTAAVGDAVAGSTAGLGQFANGNDNTVVLHGSAAENSTGDLTFAVTVTHSASNASLSIRREYAFAEVI